MAKSLRLVRQAASPDVPLISRAARWVDQPATNAAFEAGGNGISLPATPLSRTLRFSGVGEPFATAGHRGRKMCKSVKPR